jgi:hypothetical protein
VAAVPVKKSSKPRPVVENPPGLPVHRTALKNPGRRPPALLMEV